jgi:hydrogenase-4 component B
LHTINHAIFKGLLFFGAGNIYLQSHTGDIERMGGLALAIPLTTISFLVGSIAICGLPPLNGFVSEFLIYKGFFRASNLLPAYSSIALVFAMVGLAFTGGLAVACFTKLFGIIFLGQSRSALVSARQAEPGSFTLLSLAGLCLALGVFPAIGLHLVAPALAELADAKRAPTQWASPLGELQILFLLFIALVFACYGAKFWLQRRIGLRSNPTWGCGYEPITPRMQYTASSFAEELVKLGRPMLALTECWQAIESTLPPARSFSSRCADRMEQGWLLFNRGVGRLFGALRWIQSGNIRHYVLYLFAAAAFYLLCALVW